MKTILNSMSAHVSAFQKHRKIFAVIFTLVFTLLLTTSASAQQSFTGRYTGEWIASTALDEDHTGTWTISVDSDGEIKGTEYDKTTGQKAELSGFIDEDGYVDLFLKYTSGSYKIKGTLTKRGTRLTGTLKQFSGGRVTSTIDITLKRN